MTDPLFISQEDPIDFNGTLDGAGGLQLVHGSDSLADYDQRVEAEHDDLSDPAGIVRVRLFDFSSGGNTWTVNATHDPGSGSVSWSRGTDHAYYDFGPMTAEQEVDAVATYSSNSQGRTFRIKVSPTDPQPDRPR
ncbi:MAG: hypothetical protein KC457_11615 [Myxococcales bacterium]|nr:hypothetical protein [Myxococcales bacterium]